MRKAILLLTSVTTAILMCAGVALGETPSGTLDANTLSTSSNATRGWHLEDISTFGQTFTAQNSGQVTSAQVLVEHQKGTGDLLVELATLEQGKPFPQPKATATVPASEISSSSGLVTARFSEPLTVEAGKQYALLISNPRDSSGTVKLWWDDQSQPYSGGKGIWANTSSSAWNESTTWNDFGGDFIFAIYLNGTDKSTTSISSVSGSGTYDGTATLTATLEDSDGSALEDKTVEFKLGENAVCDTGTTDNTLPDCPTTDADGLATLENVSLSGYTAADSPYTDEVSASFAGDSDYEESSGQGNLTVSEADQDKLTLNAPASMAYGQAAAKLTTSGGSGEGAVSYDVGSSTGCSVTGDQLTVTDASGTCSVSATKAADGNYSSATSDAVSVTLGKASQTITFDALANKTYGDEDFTLSATGGASDKPVTYALGTGSVGCSLSGTNNATVTITGATGATDKCIITASQAGNTNYEAATSETRDFTIAQAALTITADNKSMTYGDSLPTFSYTPTGFVPGDTASVISGSVSYSTNPQASSSSQAGTYDIVPDISGLSVTNYTLTAQNGTLTVDKRQANVAYTGDNYAAVASGNANINLSANVSRTNSGTAGNLALSEVEFVVKKFGGGVQTTAYATADANGVAKTTASIPSSADPYTVEVRVRPTNSYWTSGTDIGSLSVVVSSGSARTAGGGWITDDKNTINGKSNFGFTVQNTKAGMKGNALFIYRVVEGTDQVQYVVKSNSWQGGSLAFDVNRDPARATFTGKANVQRYVNGVQDTSFNGGNHTFTVDDLDGDLKNPKVKDGYAITVRNSANQIVKQQGSRTSPVTLGGGNVLVQKK